jgi:hypothetical protein
VRGSADGRHEGGRARPEPRLPCDRDARRRPNLSPKRTTTVDDHDHLILAEIRSPQTLADLRAGRAIEVNVADPILRRG